MIGRPRFFVGLQLNISVPIILSCGTNLTAKVVRSQLGRGRSRGGGNGGGAPTLCAVSLAVGRGLFAFCSISSLCLAKKIAARWLTSRERRVPAGTSWPPAAAPAGVKEMREATQRVVRALLPLQLLPPPLPPPLPTPDRHRRSLRRAISADRLTWLRCAAMLHSRTAAAAAVPAGRGGRAAPVAAAVRAAAAESEAGTGFSSPGEQPTAAYVHLPFCKVGLNNGHGWHKPCICRVFVGGLPLWHAGLLCPL